MYRYMYMYDQSRSQRRVLCICAGGGRHAFPPAPRARRIACVAAAALTPVALCDMSECAENKEQTVRHREDRPFETFYKSFRF